MTTTIPPAHSNIAASLDWETATLADLLNESARSGAPACTLYRVMHERASVNVEDSCDCANVR